MRETLIFVQLHSHYPTGNVQLEFIVSTEDQQKHSTDKRFMAME